MNDLDERLLWLTLERAWTEAELAYRVAGAAYGPSLRGALLARRVDDFDVAMWPFCSALEDVIDLELTEDQILRFAKAFESQMFALDREDLARHVGLGDDGFIDARGFIVAMGEEHFKAVRSDPTAALVGVGVEQAYMALIRAYETHFQEPFPRFGIRVTTCSNLDGWPKKKAEKERAARVARVVEAAWTELHLDADPSDQRALARSVHFPALDERDLTAVLSSITKRLAERVAPD